MADILYVDDDPVLRTAFSHEFGQHHHITSTATMAEAMEKLATTKFDLVVADELHVKGATGTDLADDMKRKLDATPMILLTGDFRMQPSFMQMHSAIKAIVHKPPNIADLKVTMDRVIAESLANEAKRVTDVDEAARKDIESLREQIARREFPDGVHTRRMVELIRVASPNDTLQDTPQATANRELLANKVAEIVEQNPSLKVVIEHYFSRIETHSPETYEHINNSTKLLTQVVAAKLMPPDNRGAGEYTVDAEKGAAVCIATMLHDYGKLYIPDDILHYPGLLEGANRTIMRNHVVYSTQMIEALGLPESLKDIEKIIATHHENLDGTGYPNGLNKGNREDMPYITHIHPIIDRFKAMTSVRSYRPHPMSLEKATVIMEDEANRGMISQKLLDLFLPLMWQFRGREYIAPAGKQNSIS